MRGKSFQFLRSLPVIAALMFMCGFAGGLEAPPGYPERAVEVIVPFAAGGGMDKTARVLAKHTEKRLGNRINVVNLTAGGNLQGKLEGINAKPDGYALTIWATGLVTDELLVRGATYTHRDVLPVCMVAYDPHVVVVGKVFSEQSGVKTFDDLLRYMRENPGRVTMGVGGNWTSHDFARVKIENAAGAKFARMPFLGGGPALQAVAAGNCDVATPIVPEFMELLDSPDVIPLAVTYKHRLHRLPDVPSAEDLGYPDLTQIIWKVIGVPRGTPEPIVNYLADVFGETMRDPDFVSEAYGMGITAIYMKGGDLAQFIASEYEFYLRQTEEWGIGIQR